MYKKITTIEEVFGEHHHKHKKYYNTIWLDVPLMLRIMEYSKTEAKSDEELHEIVERMFEMCCDHKPLSMENYAAIVTPEETTPAA